MPDNLKKKKLDRKRIALNQPHETAYMRKITRELLEFLDAFKRDIGIITVPTSGPSKLNFSKAKVKRICEAFLKLSSRKK